MEILDPKIDSPPQTARAPELGPQTALWRTITRLDKNKVNSGWVALRNCLAVALPLGIGIAIGKPLGGVAIATGALNVSYSDARDPYAQRARRMLAWSILGAVAVFTGSATGAFHGAAIVVAAAWAFVAGMVLSISTRAGDLGLNTLVALIVFAARGAMSPKGALYAALLVLAGGLLQTFFSLLLWPVRRDSPERHAIGGVYLDLSEQINPHTETVVATPLTNLSAQVQDTLSALGRDHSVEGERFRVLFDQADRIRMSVFALGRIRSEVVHSASTQARSQTMANRIDRLFENASKLLAAVGRCLISGESGTEETTLLKELHTLVQEAHNAGGTAPDALAEEAASGFDTLAGQLRAVVELANHTIPAGMDEFSRREAAHPWKLQARNWLGTLRANLDLRSAICRHAIRLSVCVAIGDAIGRSVSWERSYWLPMTVAVVLKPDFTATFSRGVLRLAGTFAGLVAATILYHIFPESALSQVFLVGAFTFLLRSIGPANYGVFSIAVSGLIVFLIAAAGIPPKQVVVLRGLNTLAGGIFALIAYAVWPTWERMNVSEAMAEMLDACRLYFHAVAERFGSMDATLESDLDQTRSEWRRARSNAEGSVDRVSSEPKITAENLSRLTSMLASSDALVHAIMGLEAGLIQGQPHTPPKTFEIFANDVELTLYFLAASLRGSYAATKTLPKLREDHRRMMEARKEFSSTDEFILLETDRVTTILNTLREQTMRLQAPPS